jgi:predicted metal-dependent HD superfamily phosphohydrolase
MDRVDRDGMARRWTDLLQPFGAPPEAIAAAYDDIAAQYGQTRRWYHTLEHIELVLDRVAELRDVTSDPVAVELAAWLHDVVYDARAGDNEARSAAFARESLPGLGVPGPTADRVAELILTTVTHEAAGDPDAAVLLDADLAVLAGEPSEYDQYCAEIREEYGWLPDVEYRAGRAALLRRLLERGDIFHTERMRAKCEARARHNMQRELAALETARRD